MAGFPASPFDESKHRRARDGRFAPKPTVNASSAATADVLAAAAFDDTEPDVLPAGDTAKQERLREVEARLGHSLPLDRLDPETAGLLDRRFGLSTGTPSSLHEEADRLGMDPIDVRRREAEALRSLRDLHTSA